MQRILSAVLTDVVDVVEFYVPSLSSYAALRLEAYINGDIFACLRFDRDCSFAYATQYIYNNPNLLPFVDGVYLYDQSAGYSASEGQFITVDMSLYENATQGTVRISYPTSGKYYDNAILEQLIFFTRSRPVDTLCLYSLWGGLLPGGSVFDLYGLPKE